MEWNGHNPLAPQPRSRTQRLSPVHIRRQEARRERCIYQFSYPPPAPPAAAGWNRPPPPLSLRYRESREYCFAPTLAVRVGSTRRDKPNPGSRPGTQIYGLGAISTALSLSLCR